MRHEFRRNRALHLAFIFSVLTLSFQNCSDKGFDVIQTETLASQGSNSQSLVFGFTQDPNGKIFNTNSVSIGFQFSTTLVPPNASFQCSTDQAPLYAACTSPFNYSKLTDGSHYLKLRVLTNSTEVSPEIMTTFTVDTTPPKVAINSAPMGTSGATQATVMFSATDSLSGLKNSECSLDNAPYAPCQSPVTLQNLAAGAHTYGIRATDLAGNVSAVQTANWTIAVGVLTATITQFPSSFSNSKSATFVFSGSSASGQPLNMFQCSHDGAALAACTSPYTLSNLPDGKHTVTVYGLDSMNQKSAPQNYSWVVDTVVPTISITSKPANPTTASTATFAFTVADPGMNSSGIKSTQCKLDSGAYAACSGSITYNSGLGAGSHTFTVQATDNAGNVATSTPVTWTVTAPPTMGSITLAWDAVTAAGLASYKVHYGTTRGNYLFAVPVASSQTTVKIASLNLNQTYYFVVTSVDANGKESVYSNEVSGMPK